MEMTLERCGFRASGTYSLIRLAREARLDMLGPTEHADPINSYARHRTRQRAKRRASHRGTRNPRLGEGGMSTVGRASRRFKGGIGIALAEGGWHNRHKHGRGPAAIGRISKRRALVLQDEGGKKRKSPPMAMERCSQLSHVGSWNGGIAQDGAVREERRNPFPFQKRGGRTDGLHTLITDGCSGDRNRFFSPVFGVPDGTARCCLPSPVSRRRTRAGGYNMRVETTEAPGRARSRRTS